MLKCSHKGLGHAALSQVGKLWKWRHRVIDSLMMLLIDCRQKDRTIVTAGRACCGGVLRGRLPVQQRTLLAGYDVAG